MSPFQKTRSDPVVVRVMFQICRHGIGSYTLITLKLFALYQTLLYHYNVVNDLHNDAQDALAIQSNK